MYQSKKHRLSKRQAMDELKTALDNHWFRSKRTDMEAIRVASEIINSIEDVIGNFFNIFHGHKSSVKNDNSRRIKAVPHLIIGFQHGSLMNGQLIDKNKIRISVS